MYFYTVPYFIFDVENYGKLKIYQRRNFTARDKIAHNRTEWPLTLRQVTLTSVCDLDMRTRPRYFSSLRD